MCEEETFIGSRRSWEGRKHFDLGKRNFRTELEPAGKLQVRTKIMTAKQPKNPARSSTFMCFIFLWHYSHCFDLRLYDASSFNSDGKTAWKLKKSRLKVLEGSLIPPSHFSTTSQNPTIVCAFNGLSSKDTGGNDIEFLLMVERRFDAQHHRQLQAFNWRWCCASKRLPTVSKRSLSFPPVPSLLSQFTMRVISKRPFDSLA